MPRRAARSRLALGTAQLGIEYGVANTAGRPSREEAFEVISAAWSGGVRRFDTAPAYGTSEKVLGEALRRLDAGREARIVTKVGGSGREGDWVERSLASSAAHLGVPKIDTLLFHDERVLDQWEPTGRIVMGLMDKGLIGCAGVSVYTVERAIQALTLDGLGAIQIPGNVLDRRFADTRFMERAAERNVQLMVRSVFLQGLLLMPPAEVPAHLAEARPALEKIRRLAADLNIGRQALLLGYCAEKWPSAWILFGAEKADQVQVNLKAWDEGAARGVASAVDDALTETASEYIVRPDRWRSP